LSGASELTGTVVEVLTGDTLTILPSGHDYDDESELVKISLASIRAPRVGNERMGRPDEAYSHECKDRLRVLTVGKPCKVKVVYERDIPIGEVSFLLSRVYSWVLFYACAHTLSLLCWIEYGKASVWCGLCRKIPKTRPPTT